MLLSGHSLGFDEEGDVQMGGGGRCTEPFSWETPGCGGWMRKLKPMGRGPGPGPQEHMMVQTGPWLLPFAVSAKGKWGHWRTWPLSFLTPLTPIGRSLGALQNLIPGHRGWWSYKQMAPFLTHSHVAIRQGALNLLELTAPSFIGCSHLQGPRKPLHPSSGAALPPLQRDHVP